jgi:hypothetical protein
MAAADAPFRAFTASGTVSESRSYRSWPRASTVAYPVRLGLDATVTRHCLLDAIVPASATGLKQVA